MKLTERGETLLRIRLAGSLRRSDVVETLLEELRGAGLVREVSGAAGEEPHVCLTDDGRRAGEELLTLQLESCAARTVVEACYAEFLPVNAAFLGLCRDWQLRPADGDAGGAEVLNDHTESAWDRDVLDRLVLCHGTVVDLVDRLAGALDRFSAYRGRFEKALARIQAGEPQWFTRPLIDSYHTVWFELHENLLATLGLDRHTESRNV